MSSVNQATNDNDFPLEEYLRELYTIKPFDFDNLTFAELPDHAKQFLLKNGIGDPAAAQESLTAEILHNVYHRLMLEARTAEQSAIEHDTYELNWDIVSCMLALTPPPPGHEPTQQDQLLSFTLTNVLIPEWRSYLDRALERIDALIWFEIVLTRGSTFQQPLETHLQLRIGDVDTMLKIVIRSLQRIYEQLQGERSEIAGAEPGEGIELEDAQTPEETPEDSNSDNDDATSDISTSDSDASVGVTDYEEHLFSDSEPEPQTEVEIESSLRYVHENIKYYDGYREHTYWRGCDFFTDKGRNFVPHSSSSF